MESRNRIEFTSAFDYKVIYAFTVNDEKRVFK